MKLCDCKYGVLVQECKRGDGYGVADKRVGMVVGITNNCQTADSITRGKSERAIPLIKWSDGVECGIHYGNIELFKDF